MPAPKGNKFAAKENPKNKRLPILMRQDAAEKLKILAKQEKVSMTQVIERALLAAYPQDFDGLF